MTPDAFFSELDELQSSVAAGDAPVPGAVTDPVLGRVVAVACEAGSPLSPALVAAGDAGRDRADVAAGVRVATAQARAVATGLLALPVVLVPGLSGLLELDLVAFYRSATGRTVATVAGGLMVLGMVLVRLLVARASRPGHPPSHGGPTDDEVIDLLATACSGALAGGAACRVAAAHAPLFGSDLQRAALALELGQRLDLPAPFDRVHRTLERAGRLGAPAEPALRRLAATVRAERRTAALESVQRLPALLAFPTALCLLPASILLVGAPLVASGLAGGAGTP